MELTTNVKAIQEFFSANDGRPVDMKELRALSTTEREQLGALCAKALGKEIAPTA